MNTLRKILLSSVSAACFCASTFAMAADRVGVIGGANPHISAVAEDKSTRDLKIGDDIFFKDTISADAKGNAQLLFVDKSALTVGANSSVVIDEFVYNPDTSGGNMVMRSTKGTFRFIGGALSKKNAVEIKTPVGTIGIRGGIAIVNIDPNTGATNATFVYGDMMTFKNLAGDMQTVTDRGMGMNLPTGTAIPEVFQMTSEQMAGQVQALVAPEGGNAGATDIPSEGDVGKGLILETDKDANAGSDAMKGPEGDGQQPVDSADGKDKGDSADKGKDGDGKKTDAAAGKDPNGKGPNDPNAKDPSQKDPNAKDPAAKGTNGDGAKAAPAANAPIKLTSDGGYIDADGKKRSAADLAAYRAATANSNGTGGTNNDPNGGPNRGPTGTAANGGFGTAANATRYGTAAPVAGGTNGGLSGPITLTSDGGYKDASGKYYTAADLAALRASGNTVPVAPAAGTAGTTAYYGGAVAPTGTAAYYGTVTAPTGTTSATNYYGSTTYIAPYVAPVNTTTTAYVAPYVPPVTTTTTTVSSVDTAAKNLETNAYNLAKGHGATDAQATAAGVAVKYYFLNIINSGSEFTAAVTAANVYANGYIVDNQANYTGGGAAGSTEVNTAANTLQTNAYNQAKTAGATDAQATAAGTAARTYFFNLINAGSTVASATAATTTQIGIYIANHQTEYTSTSAGTPTSTTITSVATNVQADAYAKAIAHGASTAQATAAGVAAKDHFLALITVGTTTFAQMDAAVADTNSYIDSYIATNQNYYNSTNASTYVAAAKPPIVDSANYSNAVAQGTAAYVAARSTTCDHNCAMGAGNVAYNQALVQYEQTSENNLYNNSTSTATKVYKTANEVAGNPSNNIVSTFLQPVISGAQGLNIETQMDTKEAALKAACPGGCNYINWDVWAKVQPNASAVAMNDLYGQIVPYVYGVQTTPAQIPGSIGVPINATYTGSSMLSTSGLATPEFGVIHANITLSGSGTANLTHFDFNIPSQSGVVLNYNGSTSMNTATFNNLPVSASGYNGLVNGALFGPAAQNIGGNLTYGTGASATNLGAGVYMGGITSTTP